MFSFRREPGASLISGQPLVGPTSRPICSRGVRGNRSGRRRAVGPGPGLTTDVPRRQVAALTAVEVDGDLAAALANRLAGTNVEVVHADATDSGQDIRPFKLRGPSYSYLAKRFRGAASNFPRRSVRRARSLLPAHSMKTIWDRPCRWLPPASTRTSGVIEHLGGVAHPL